MDNPKYLPIKIVQKREKIDESLTEAGGSDMPNWMLKVPHEERSKMILSTLNEIGLELKNRFEKQNFIPATLELTLDNRTLSKSHRSSIRNLVDVNKKNNVIAFQDEGTLLIKVENNEDLKKIEKNVSEFQKNKQGIASIVDSKIFKPKVYVEEEEILKIKLIDFQDSEINYNVHEAFKKKCRELNLEFEHSNYTSDLIVYKIKFEEKAFVELQEFSAISSIEDMPNFKVSFVSEINSDLDSLELKVPEVGQDYPIVGILDSGLTKNGYLAPWILADKFSPYINSDKDEEHGSAVASVVLYYDLFEGNEYTGNKGCFLYDACVVPKKSLIGRLTEFELIENIQEAIKSKPDINIWNLSIGWSKEIEMDKISDFGAALDFLSDENNILICTSVGNCKNFEIGKPRGRIQASADSVRAISVGSIAHTKSLYDKSERDEPSPFTRKGPGPFNLVKPEVVHYGGNAGIDPAGIIKYTGTNTINSAGSISSKAGTSFSTPIVTSILSSLENEIDEKFDPLLIKGLCIHSAKYPKTSLDEKSKVEKLGFGVPQSVNDILYNSENEITLILRDRVEKGNFIEVLDFPFPKNMVENGFYYGEISVTLVASPDLIQSQGEEYCQSNIDVYFGTYNQKVTRSGKTIRNNIGKDKQSKNLLNPDIYSQNEIKKNTFFKDERLLKNYYQKFQPVKKWVINLDDLSETNKIRYLEYPKLWYLKIEGLFRDHLEKTKNNISTDFCLIITIKDSKNKTKVYENVTKGLRENNFIQNDIKIKTKITLRN